MSYFWDGKTDHPLVTPFISCHSLTEFSNIFVQNIMYTNHVKLSTTKLHF